MLKYNLNHLIRVKVLDRFDHSFLYEFKKEKKFLGFVIQKEGLYNIFGEYVCPDIKSCREASDNEFQLIDNILYKKAHVVATFINNIEFVKYFDSYEEALNWANTTLDPDFKLIKAK